MKSRLLLRPVLSILAASLFAACDKPKPDAPAGGTEISPPAAAEKAAGKARIVSWNLQWFPGHKPDATEEMAAEHMAAAQKAVAGLNPDILLLQEVRGWAGAAKLCEAVPGLTPHVVTAFDQIIPDARPQNQVVAAKMPADSAWSATWVGGYQGPPRGYAFAALEAGGGRFLLCWSLHLKSNVGAFDSNVSMRAESARQLLAHVRDMVALYSRRGPCAVVVAGDMNTSGDDPKFAKDPTLRGLIGAGLWWTHEGVPFANRTTIPGEGSFADNCFDHIFTAGLGRPVAVVKPFPGLSDHNPVVLDVDFSEGDFTPRLDLAAGLQELASVPAPNVPVDLPGVLAANDAAGIAAAVGKNATIRGKVSQVGQTKTASVTFINFEGNARTQFIAIVKKDHLASISAAFGGKLDSLAGKTVEVRGEVFLYKETPEIELRAPADIRVVE
jgi:endonuclease/exonuclease/phosphatase family metal-dependent hydrolase